MPVVTTPTNVAISRTVSTFRRMIISAKGAALGTVLAFMMSVIALSIPEMIILRKVLTLKLIAVFVAVVAAGILAVGFLFNALFT